MNITAFTEIRKSKLFHNFVCCSLYPSAGDAGRISLEKFSPSTLKIPKNSSFISSNILQQLSREIDRESIEKEFSIKVPNMIFFKKEVFM